MGCVSAAKRMSLKAVRASKAVLGQIALVFAFSIISTAASAQAVDWLVNIDDSGFDPYPAGGFVEYEIAVTNNGFGNAPATEVEFTVPAGSTFQAASGDITNCTPLPAAGGVLVTCDVPPLGDGETASTTIEITAPTETVLSLTATVLDAGNDDDDPGNDTITETTTITEGSDWELTVDPIVSAAAGSDVTFAFTAENLGPNTATSLTIEFPAPVGVTNIVPPAGCTLSGGVYTCTVTGSFPVGAMVEFDFDAQVSAGSSSTITAIASINASTPNDAVATNNVALVDVPVTSGTDVEIEKSRSPSGDIAIGETITWDLDVSYTGDAPTGLTISDSLPSAYGNIMVVDPDGWTCTVSGQLVECTLAGGGAPGADINIAEIEISAEVLTAGTQVNTATVTSTGPPEQDPSNNSDTDGGVTTIVPVVDLSAIKTPPSPPLSVVGGSRNFQIRGRNNGNQPFVGTFVMEDTVPAGVVIDTAVGSGWTCDAPVTGPGTLTCTRVYTAGAPLGVNVNTPAVTTGVTTNTAGTVTNTLEVSSPDANFPDPDLDNNIVTQDITVSTGGATVDIEVTKAAGSAVVASGDLQTYTIVVQNNSGITATNVELTDIFGQLINSASGPGEGYEGVVPVANNATGLSCSDVASGTTGRSVTCNIATLPVCDPGLNECPTFTFSVRPGGNADLSRDNTAEAYSLDQGDSNIANNTDTASFELTSFMDLTVAKSATPDPVDAGGIVTFVVTATNVDDGRSAAINVQIDDTLPNDLVYISATPSTGSCSVEPAAGSTTTPANNQVLCNLGTINNGSQQTVTIRARPLISTIGSTLTNTVDVASVANGSTPATPEDPTGLTNTDTADFEVVDAVMDILINKDDSVDPILTGANTVYTITVTNNGPDADEMIQITDTLPASILTFQSVTANDGGSCSLVPAVGSFGGTLICGWDYLEPGDSVSVEVTMEGDARGSIPNTVVVTSTGIANGFDTQMANNETEETTTVRNRVDLGITKAADAPGTFAVEDNFNYTAVLTSDGGPTFKQALLTMVTDTLPSGMTLTGTPTAVIDLGAATANSCTGAAGATAFTCDFGTVDPGSQITITIPVEVAEITTDTQNFDNEIEVTTVSGDSNPSNNEASDDVDISASEISGTVFWDFADDASLTAGDIPLGGIEVTLTGTSADGRMITETVLTNPDGTYEFILLPEGEYTVTRGAITEPNFEEGTTTGGPVGSPIVSSPTVISSIDLPDSTSAPENDFPILPIPSVGIAKQLDGALVQADDGSFTATFDLVVENFALEDFSDVDVTDPLAGAHPLFGSFVTLGDPINDAMANGTYTVITAPSGSCGGFVAGFDGDGTQTLAENFTLGAGLSCTITFEIRVMPTAPLPVTAYENQATVEATGALSGLTSADTPLMMDISDDGVDPDPSGDSDAGGADEDDPTPLAPDYSPSIALTKFADVSAVSDPPVLNDVVTYTFQVRNTGDVTLTNITITDTLPGIVLMGGPITLTPGQTDFFTFSAEYELTQDNVDDGFVENQATVEGTDPFGTVVDDPSGDTFADDNPLITPFTEEPSIALVKTSDLSALQDPPRPGDIITFNFAVTNTGNVTLTDVTITDDLVGIDLTGDPIPSLTPGQTDDTTYEATYAITQDDIDNAEVINQAVATGTPPSLPPVMDDSGTTNGDDDPTVSPIDQVPSIELEKSVDVSTLLDGADVGELLNYTFVVTNTGNVPLDDISITDLLPGIMMMGGPISLPPLGVDTDTFTATYPVTAADIEAGEVLNTATVSGTNNTPGGSGEVVMDEDDAEASVGTIEANPEPYPPFLGDGGTTTSVLESDLLNGETPTLDDVTITVLGGDPGPILDPETGLITLPPGFPAGVYTVDYEIASRLIPTLTDTTTETIVQGALPAIETVKTQEFTDNGDGRDGVGDVVTYTIEVTNTGNVVLNDVVLDDTLTDLNGGALSLDADPVFVSATDGSAEGTLEIGEVATYTAEFTINLQAVNAGGVENVAVATGTPVYPPGVPVGPPSVSDISDDGNDNDGNTTDDPTVLELAPAISGDGELVLTKTTPREIVERGGVVPYTIRVENLGSFVAGPFDIVDQLPPGFLYVPGSATIGGVEATVTLDGARIIWEDVTIPAEGEVVATLSARILNGTRSGYHTNTVSVIDPATGATVVGPATADVRILPEAVFDCAEVIGKVFADLDGDGYQDPVPDVPLQSSGITDQSYNPEKFDVEVVPQTEVGIPGVRLATVDGLIITTDEYGRFSVPCAALPADGGSNFILKLDDRSLPTGYRMTTENPRVMRLTPGMMSEMNFGATLGRVARVDLNGAAFYLDSAGEVAMQPHLIAGIEQVLGQIGADPTTIRLAFHVPASADSDTVAQARGLLDMVERHINARWRDVGTRPLRVEQSIVRVQ